MGLFSFIGDMVEGVVDLGGDILKDTAKVANKLGPVTAMIPGLGPIAATLNTISALDTGRNLIRGPDKPTTNKDDIRAVLYEILKAYVVLPNQVNVVRRTIYNLLTISTDQKETDRILLIYARYLEKFGQSVNT